MANPYIALIAIFTVAEENIDKVKPLFESLLEPTRKEDACLHYELFQDIEAPNRFHFFEKWAGLEGLMAHMKTEHVSQVMTAVKPLLAEPPKVTKLSLVGE